MAATMPDRVAEVPIHRACGRYVDHFTFRSAAASR
jgi:hypothetical protein